jgi:hypothetical protein
MAIVQIPQHVASSAKETAEDLKDRVRSIQWSDVGWKRTAAIGSLVTGAVLLLQGKRKAGIVATAAGAAFVLLENPKEAQVIWNNIPEYLEGGRRFLERFESFVGELSVQGGKLRSFLEETKL